MTTSPPHRQPHPGPEFKRRLLEIAGREGFSTQPEDLTCASYDATQLKFRPWGVVWPNSSAMVSAILTLANQFRVPVTPRGAGTGFSGGALPLFGGIVLSMVRMNRIISIDPENMLAEVEPGVITADLDRAAARHGLFYPPDPASLDISTIGGNVAESAGGPRAVKYGVTRDFVLGIEAVLPTGEIIVTGARTTKCVVGYDLTRLLVGSEGTLAVITRIFLRLIPRPEAMVTLLVIFPEVDSAARIVSAIIARGIVPTTLEFMDRSSIQCVQRFTGIGFPPGAGAVLIIELDGSPETITRQNQTISDLCREAGAIEISTAEKDEDREKLWAARRAVSPSLHQLAPDKFNEDIVVPRSKVPEILVRIDHIAQRHDLKIVTFGHAGDGNIHVNIMTDLSIPGVRERVEPAIRDLFRETLSLGGTISGEHGIGITKAPFISMELNSAAILAMKAIKRALDPNDILNPGKMFPSER